MQYLKIIMFIIKYLCILALSKKVNNIVELVAK